jgi:prepilin-type N-terminal cleavage/methylation domain-containing protein
VTAKAERRMSSDSGFTLVEALVALLMLAVIFAGLGGAAIAGLTSVRHEKDSLAATQFAAETSERFQRMSWNTIAPVDPAIARTLTLPPAQYGGTQLTPQAIVRWMDDPCNGSSTVPPAGGAAHPARDYLRIELTVTWTNAKGRSRELKSESFRAPAFGERKPARTDTFQATSC